MNIKDNVRKRRQDRMRQLQENAARFTSTRSYASVSERYPPHHSGAELPARSPFAPQAEDERLNDPEYVWKQREKQLFGAEEEEYRSAGAGGDAADSAAGSTSWYASYASGAGSGSYTPPYYAPQRNEERWKEWNTPPTAKQLRLKLIICAALFGAVWLLFQSEHPYAKTVQGHIETALKEDIHFDELAVWYEENFKGAPSFLPAFQEWTSRFSSKAVSAKETVYYAPVLGRITESFAESGEGVSVQTEPGAPVSAMDSGRVIFVGQTEATGLTVIVQHPNYIQSVSGNLAAADVKVNDWVKGGQQIGLIAAEGAQPFYFAVKKHDQYFDPSGVIPFD
ncbi:M23 family metallopeptidase [Paenibacillus turpanensis]|uniref:M23 family metallopeptidase n=1 Tax=Paenibacillus turpanensis TaxID=2689078 RepID=UPI00140BA65A|nr:M23 family metallopeptidase [Paenibacillus turpanensis]